MTQEKFELKKVLRKEKIRKLMAFFFFCCCLLPSVLYCPPISQNAIREQVIFQIEELIVLSLRSNRFITSFNFEKLNVRLKCQEAVNASIERFRAEHLPTENSSVSTKILFMEVVKTYDRLLEQLLTKAVRQGTINLDLYPPVRFASALMLVDGMARFRFNVHTNDGFLMDFHPFVDFHKIRKITARVVNERWRDDAKDVIAVVRAKTNLQLGHLDFNKADCEKMALDHRIAFPNTNQPFDEQYFLDIDSMQKSRDLGFNFWYLLNNIVEMQIAP